MVTYPPSLLDRTDQGLQVDSPMSGPADRVRGQAASNIKMLLVAYKEDGAIKYTIEVLKGAGEALSSGNALLMKGQV